LKAYYLLENHGNDVVIPDGQDLKRYRNGELTLQGFRVSFLAKLMRPEAEEWMERVSDEAVSMDVVLVSNEDNGDFFYRKFLAEMMINMFSGRKKLRYLGELEV
jgi:hypothetical protein